jgi:hypothetical protein
MAAKGVPVHIYGDWDGSAVKRAQNDLSTFQRQATGFSGAIGKSFLGMGAAIGGAFAIGSIISSVTNYLQDAAQAAIADEKSMVALSTAMKNVGESFNNASAEDFISQMALSKGVADDQLRPALQRLITATGDTAKAQALLGTALDVSAATGKDLVAVSQAIGRASLGQVSALTRLGVPLDANIVKTKDFDAAIASLNKNFGGQASAAASTYGGQIARLQVAAGEAQETIGYALLDAVQNVTDAFGGTGGFAETLLQAGEYAANLVAGLGQAVKTLADISSAANGAEISLGGASVSLGDFGREAIMALPGVGLQLKAIDSLTESGEQYRLGQQRVADSLRASEALYAGYAASLDNVAAATRDVEMDTEAAKERMDEMKAAIDRVRGAMSDRQAMIDFRNALADIKGDIDKNSRSLDLNSQKGRDNQEALLQAFGAAADAAEAWGRRTGASGAEIELKFAGLGKKVVNEFVAQGFKRKDVESFAGDAGIWTSAISTIGTSVNAEAIRLGKNIDRGIVDGIISNAHTVRTAISGTVLGAIQAGKDAAKIKSPSEVTRDQIGIPIIDGIIKGMVDKTTDLKSATQTAVSEALDVAKGVIDVWDAEIANRFSKVEAADAAITNWVSSTKDQLASAFDLSGVFEGSFDENGKLVVSKFQGGVEAGLAQFQWYTNVLSAIAANPGSEQLVAFLQSQGVANGGLYGQALIDNGLVQYMIDNLSTVTTTADTTAQALVPSFLLAAQDSAQGFYDQFVAMYGKDAPMRKKLEGLMDRLAKSLERTTTITVKTVYEAAGLIGRASGGPVLANQAYLVGERGPEVLVMGSQSGTIIPNGDLPMATGFTRGGDGAAAGSPVVINVHAGMGTDGAEVGRQVVDALKAYSRRNGPLPLAVAS